MSIRILLASQSVPLILECVDRMSINTSLVQAIPSVDDYFRKVIFPKISVAPVFDEFHRVASRPNIRAPFKEAACRYCRQPVEDLKRIYDVRSVSSFLQ